MIKIDPAAVYERAELAEAFPTLSNIALTRCMLAWGGSRPYPGSRKVFIRGDAILQALEPPTSQNRTATPDAGPVIRPHRNERAYVQRRTVR